MKIKRVPISEVREKALPILLAGYEKRNALRARSESLLRSPEKVARDKKSTGKPRLSSI